MPAPKPKALVVEDDRFLRVIGCVLDPSTAAERYAAYADFFARDEPDFDAYCRRVRERVGALYPVEVRLVETAAAMRAALPGSAAVIVESLAVGKEELAVAPDLRVVQTYGCEPHGIDTAACVARGLKVLTIRRRANITCAEVAFALMLTLAKKLHRLAGRISVEQLAQIGHPYRPFDRRHAPNANWSRISGLRTLNESALGLIGLGEIGREIAIRAAAFGMRILYCRRSRLPEAEEREVQATYMPQEQLLAMSDWVVLQLPTGPSSHGCIGRAQLAQMKPGAFLVNLSCPDVVDRDALIEALRSGRLGGFALDPLYDEPGRRDDELLSFDNVVISPHIAAQLLVNSLDDLADMMERIAKELDF